MFSCRDIKQCDELTFDYGWIADEFTKQITCQCGASNCRKFLYRSTPKDIVLLGGIPNKRNVTCYFAAPLQMLVRGLCAMPHSLFGRANENPDLNPNPKEIDPILNEKLSRVVELLRQGKSATEEDVETIVPLLMSSGCETDPDSDIPAYFQYQDCFVALDPLIYKFWPTLGFTTAKIFIGGKDENNLPALIDPKMDKSFVFEVRTIMEDNQSHPHLPSDMSTGINQELITEPVPKDWERVKDFVEHPRQRLTFVCPEYFVVRVFRFRFIVHPETQLPISEKLDDIILGSTAISFEPTPNTSVYARLVAFVLHIGSLESGHYVTYYHHLQSDRWISYDDTDICLDAKEGTLLSGSGYIFLYHRCSKRDFLTASEVESDMHLKLMRTVVDFNLSQYNLETMSLNEKEALEEQLCENLLRHDQRWSHLLHKNGTLTGCGMMYLRNVMHRVWNSRNGYMLTNRRFVNPKRYEEEQQWIESSKIVQHFKKSTTALDEMTHRRNELYHRFEESKDLMHDDMNFQANLTLLMYVVPSKIVNDAALKAKLDSFKGKTYWRGKTQSGEEEAIHRQYFRDPEMSKLFEPLLVSCKTTPNEWNEITNDIKQVLRRKDQEYNDSQFIQLKFTSRKRKQRKNQFYELLPTKEKVWIGKTASGRTEKLEDSWVDFNFWNEKPFLSECQRNPNIFVNVPVGAAKTRKRSATFGLLVGDGRNNKKPIQTNIAVHQRGEPTCVFASLASALAYGGDLHGKAAYYVKKYCAISLEKTNRMTFANDIMFRMNYIIEKVTDLNLLMDRTLLDCKFFILCQLQDSVGAISHAITIHNNLIFDGNEEHPLPLTKANLDHCCRSIQYPNVCYKQSYMAYRYSKYM